MLLSTYFEKFIANIQPTQDRITAISEAHTTLRTHLTQDAALHHPIADSFLSGSYARHTAIDPIKDADIILILQETEISTDRALPDPHQILLNLRTAIDEFYEQVNLQTQRRSIQINLPDENIQMDIVPAIAPHGKTSFLYVPDYTQGFWIPSHPAAHLSFTTDTNTASDGRFVRVAKAFKWWRTQTLDPDRRPKSFLLEVMVAYSLDIHAPTVCEAFVSTLKNLLHTYHQSWEQKILPQVPDPGLPQNDLVTSCGWTLQDFLWFYAQLSQLAEIADLAIDPETDKVTTLKLWQSVFGDVYPNSVSESDETKISAAIATFSDPPPKTAFPYSVKISARLAANKDSTLGEHYPSNGRKLPKNWWLQFRLETTNVPQPYNVRWTVQNHGREARAANDLQRRVFPGTDTQWERIFYKGHHYMNCEILKGDRVVACTRHIVNIA